MLVKEVSMIANDLALLLDEFEVEQARRDRAQLLERGLLLSVRGLNVLVNEPLIKNSDEYLEDLQNRLSLNPWAQKVDLRHDSVTLQLFLAAEYRLLEDLGMSAEAIDRFRASLVDAMSSGVDGPRGLGRRMTELIGDLERELARIHSDERDRHLVSRLAGVFETLGGALLVVGNAAAGALTAPAAPVTVIGAAISVAAGSEIISQGVDRARG